MIHIKNFWYYGKPILLFLIVVAITITIGVFGFSLLFYRTDYDIVLANTDASPTMDNPNLYVLCNVKTDDYQDLLQEGFNMLPVNLQNMLNDRWIVVIQDESDAVFSDALQEKLETMNSTGTTYRLGAETFLHQKVIALYTKEGTISPLLQTNFIHEVGHAAAYEYGYLEQQKEFLALFQKYQGKYIPQTDTIDEIYANIDEKEFFACVFTDYIFSPDEIQESYPDLYEYMYRLSTNYPERLNVLHKMRYSIPVMVSLLKEMF